MENTKVVIKSNVDHVVGISNPEYRINRTWEKKGVTRIIEFDVLQALLYEPGVEQLFTDGYLIIDDMEVKKALGLEPDDATEPVNIIVLSDTQKENLLRNKPFVEFKVAIENMSYNQLYELANFAVEKAILIDYDKNDFFLKRVGVNVDKSIENLRLAEEK